MITNNPELNQYIANLKAHCADVLVAANKEAMNSSNDYTRCVELNARIVDYQNFINMLNMEMFYPKSALNSTARELSVGDEVYVITKHVSYEDSCNGIKQSIVKGYVKKCVTSKKGLFYVVMSNKKDGYHIGNFVKTSVGKTIFYSKEEAELKLKRSAK